MRRFLVIICLFIFFNHVNCANSVTILSKKNVNYSSENSIYSSDLARIEKYLFGIVYKNNSTEERLIRIEKRLFDKTFSSLTLSQRMNNIIANYKDDYNNRNYLSDYYTSSGVKSYFKGRPTGITPPISPFYYSSQPRGRYTPARVYGYNGGIPAMTRTGVQILD